MAARHDEHASLLVDTVYEPGCGLRSAESERAESDARYVGWSLYQDGGRTWGMRSTCRRVPVRRMGLDPVPQRSDRLRLLENFNAGAILTQPMVA